MGESKEVEEEEPWKQCLNLIDAPNSNRFLLFIDFRPFAYCDNFLLQPYFAINCPWSKFFPKKVLQTCFGLNQLIPKKIKKNFKKSCFPKF